MSRPISTYDYKESLNATDREDFSIFLRYPELDLESAGDASSTYSSSTLVPHSYDSSPHAANNTSNFQTNSSTAHETPDRLMPDRRSIEFGGWNEFIRLLQKSDLPQECLQHLTSLGQTILNIGTILHSTLRPNQPASVLRIGRWLLKSLKYSSTQVANQVEAVSHLEFLMAFNTRPSESQLWSTYQQRARLIAKHTSLPSKRELGLLKSLVLLYDAYVYNPFLQLYTVDHFDKEIFNMINEIYDRLMKWLQNYKRWSQGMMQLRNQYMNPLIEQLSRSESAKEELSDFKLRMAKANSVLSRPATTTMNVLETNLVNNLNLSARRAGPQSLLKRSKARYQREHTL